LKVGSSKRVQNKKVSHVGASRWIRGEGDNRLAVLTRPLLWSIYFLEVPNLQPANLQPTLTFKS